MATKKLSPAQKKTLNAALAPKTPKGSLTGVAPAMTGPKRTGFAEARRNASKLASVRAQLKGTPAGKSNATLLRLSKSLEATHAANKKKHNRSSFG